MPGLSGALLGRNRFCIRVSEISGMFVEQSWKKFVIRSVPSAASQIEASDESDESSSVVSSSSDVWSVADDALLVVGVRPGRELVLEVVGQLIAFLKETSRRDDETYEIIRKG